jgi:NADPH-dependent 7-cyano-7-deazaguanine reductase QueF
MPYLEARCTAYVARHQKKNGFADIERALHFLQKIAEVRYGIEVVVSYKPQGGHQVDPAWERSKQNPYANVTNE